jgi:hypothetical protein
VNRPFTAFGALATFAALAMFAVSSTSRSTTVQSRRLVTRQSADPSWRTGPVAIVRDKGTADDSLPADAAETDETLCLPDSIEAVFQAKPAAERLMGEESSIRPAVVEMAQDPLAAWRAPSPMDGRSHYDPFYDRIVYGAAAKPALVLPAPEPAGGVTSNLDADLTTIFRSFTAPQRRGSPHPQAGASTRPTAGNAQPGIAALRTLRVALEKWLSSQIQRLTSEMGLGRQEPVAAASPIAWEDYVDLMDDLARGSATTALSAGGSDVSGGVRSSSWLRHSAASSLYQMGLFLQAAALEMQGGKRDFAVGPDLSLSR